MSALAPTVRLRGYERPSGAVGIRNHVLVLPSVVCSTRVARAIAEGSEARWITHQHGCLHVGDDLRHTEDALMGAALNPNVGAVVVVGLGCETVEGGRLARRLAERQQVVDFVGIQAAGGTEAALSAGRAIARDRLAELAATSRTGFGIGRLCVGLDRADDALVEPLVRELTRRGAAVRVASELRGGAAHAQLVRHGAQVIVSLCAANEAPLGCASSPVVAVARDAETFEGLADDFDLAVLGSPVTRDVELLVDRVLDVCLGTPTASERRGAADFVLDRLAVTM